MLNYKYFSDITEDTNNLIMQIQHAIYDYRKCKHVKSIIMLIYHLLNPIIAQ